MAIPWKKISSFEIIDGILAAPWVVVPDEFGDVTHLQIVGDGFWTAAGGVLPACGADGIAGLALKDEALIITSCPVCALIGRIGGSSADVVDSTSDSVTAEKNTKPFPIGSQCTVVVPDKGSFGSLFLGFNTRIRPIKVSRLKVTISGVKLPPPAGS